VDVILPVVFKGLHLKKDAMTVIIMQMKNDAKFSVKPQLYLFSAMSPFVLGIFDKTQTDPPPVIRMVFALAAREPVVKLIQPPPRTSLPRIAKENSAFHGSAYTSFDIWCGHTSASTFRVIKDTDNEVYSDLLKRSKQVPDMFATDPKSIEEVTRSMYPCATAKAGHWSSFCETVATQASSGYSVGGHEVVDSGDDGSSDIDEVVDERENSDSVGHPRSRGDTLTRELDVGYAVGESSSWFILVSDIITIELTRTQGKRSEHAFNPSGPRGIPRTPTRGRLRPAAVVGTSSCIGKLSSSCSSHISDGQG
jgi:hypothetical protein